VREDKPVALTSIGDQAATIAMRAICSGRLYLEVQILEGAANLAATPAHEGGSMPIRGSTHILRNILAGTAQAIQMAAGRMHCWLHSRSDCKAACSVARPVDVLGSQGSVRCVFCRTTSAMSAPDGRASSAAVESDRHSPFRTHTLTYSIDLTCCLCLHMRRTTSATSRRSSSSRPWKRRRAATASPQRSTRFASIFWWRTSETAHS